MKKVFFLLCCTCFPFFYAAAQTNFVPGLVVTSTGDTLKGTINYQEWLLTPREILFKPLAGSADEQVFTPATCLYFEVSGQEEYRSALVSVSMDPVEFEHLSSGPDTTTQNRAVFLKVLSSGPSLSLLSYKDRIKTRYYIVESRPEAVPQELIYRKYYLPQEVNQVSADELYKKQLWALAVKHKADMPSFQRKVTSAQYTERSLQALVQLINGAAVSRPAVAALSSAPRSRFIAGAWLHRASISQHGAVSFGKSAHYTPSYLPKLSVGIDLFANPNTQRLLLRTEASVSMAAPKVSNTAVSWDGAFHSSTYEYAQLAFTLNPQVLYHVYNGRKVKVHVGAGLAAIMARYSKDRLTTTDQLWNGVFSTTVKEEAEKPQTTMGVLTFRAGMALFHKVDVSLSYTGSNISRRAEYSIHTRSISLGTSYFFN